MVWPNDPAVRAPAVAGRFYPAESEQCTQEAQSYLKSSEPASGDTRWMGGLVPHAGWICSGAIAGQTIATLAQSGPVDVVVVFGAIHTPFAARSGGLDSHMRWAMPGGQAVLATDLHPRLQQKGNLFSIDPQLHAQEHAIEVVVPMIQLAWPAARILPVEVPVLEVAELIGRKVAEAVAEAKLRAVYLASSDLTHYGTNYRFTPAGLGLAAMEWTKENDRRLLQLVTELAPERIVPEVRQHHNACGAGAIAAMLAACKQAGASSARLLRHATSFETLASIVPQPPTNAVGYASVVVA